MRKTKQVRRPKTSGTVCKPLRIVIPCTDHELARAALKAVAEMASDLDATVTLAFVHVVPFPLPLNQPDVEREHLLRSLAELAESSAMPVRVLIVLARDSQTAFRRLVPNGSLVVLATRRRWWRTAEETLARALKRDGHRVVLLGLGAGGSSRRLDDLCGHTGPLNLRSEGKLNHA